jgi:hypothetical protein
MFRVVVFILRSDAIKIEREVKRPKVAVAKTAHALTIAKEKECVCFAATTELFRGGLNCSRPF